jgi:hypothetical protein
LGSDEKRAREKEKEIKNTLKVVSRPEPKKILFPKSFAYPLIFLAVIAVILIANVNFTGFLTTIEKNSGVINLVLSPQEFLPENSVIEISLDGQTTKMTLKDFVEKVQSDLVLAEGELSDYVIIENPILEFSGEQEQIITVTIKLPESIEEPGDHETRIVVKQVPNEGESKGTTIGSVLAVYSRLNVMVPYPWKYASVKLFASNFKVNVESTFAVEITNLGEKTIFATPVIDILGPFNEKIAVLKGEEVTIKPKEKEIVNIKWTPTTMGSYYAKTSVIYNEHEARDEKMFTIGDVFIDVDSISVDKFTLGGVAKFDILLKNEWNQPIDSVYADIAITDEKGERYAISKTASKSIEAFGRQKLEAYWETTNVEKGKYKLSVSLNYLDKKTDKTFDIEVGFDSIVVSGQLVGVTPTPTGQPQGLDSYMGIIVVVVLVLAGIGIFAYYKVIKLVNSRK